MHDTSIIIWCSQGINRRFAIFVEIEFHTYVKKLIISLRNCIMIIAGICCKQVWLEELRTYVIWRIVFTHLNATVNPKLLSIKRQRYGNDRVVRSSW